MADIVFNPNHAGYGGDANARLNDFLSWCNHGRLDDWSCKRTATKGDLYIFWFGSPALRIAGIGVSVGDVGTEENKGVDWTKARNLYSCSFERLKKLTNAITLENIKGDAVLAKWWSSQPFRGRPKTMPPKAAARLLRLIERFNPRLSSLLGQFQTARSARVVTIPNDDEEAPASVMYTSGRRVRNTAKGENLKGRYGCKCQLCGYQIHVPRERGTYAEIHHMRPLGGSHGGFDNWTNMLVLCPNCHAEFDALAIAINPVTMRIHSIYARHPKIGRRLHFTGGHSLEVQNIQYHWQRFQETKVVGDSQA